MAVKYPSVSQIAGASRRRQVTAVAATPSPTIAADASILQHTIIILFPF
jgi:hypothetical protein